MKLPPEFIKNMNTLLGPACKDFFDALELSSITSVRINTEKAENKLMLGAKIPWTSNGYYLNERPLFSTDPYFHAGHYYVQEASSMVLEVILKSLPLPTDGMFLDVCAAPGGKSTLLSSFISSHGTLHCHEHNYQRALALQHNMIKWGKPNVVVTTGPLSKLHLTSLAYDFVLIDAPCSGEGMFRKEPKALEQWSMDKVHRCQRLQSEILQTASRLVKPEGYLVYSTCTYNENENEHVLAPWINSNQFCSISCKGMPVEPSFSKGIYTYRLLPHVVQGEGLSISILKNCQELNPLKLKETVNPQKKDQNWLLQDWLENPQHYFQIEFQKLVHAIPNHASSMFQKISKQLQILHMGIPLGSTKGNDFVPTHALSQSIERSQNICTAQLSSSQALEYLKCLQPQLVELKKATWQIAKYNGASLGWIKQTPAGSKNHYPKNYRILNY